MSAFAFSRGLAGSFLQQAEQLEEGLSPVRDILNPSYGSPSLVNKASFLPIKNFSSSSSSLSSSFVASSSSSSSSSSLLHPNTIPSSSSSSSSSLNNSTAALAAYKGRLKRIVVEYVNADGEDGQALYQSLVDSTNYSNEDTNNGKDLSTLTTIAAPLSSLPSRMVTSPLPLHSSSFSSSSSSSSSSSAIPSLSPVAAFAALQYAAILSQSNEGKEGISSSSNLSASASSSSSSSSTAGVSSSLIASPPSSHSVILSSVRYNNHPHDTPLSSMHPQGEPSLASPQGAVEMDGTVEPDIITDSDSDENEEDNNRVRESLSKYTPSVKSTEDNNNTTKIPDYSSLPIRQREVARVLEALIQSPAAKAFILAQQPDLKIILDNVIPQTLSSISSSSTSSSVAHSSTSGSTLSSNRRNSLAQLLSLSKEALSSSVAAISPSITVPNPSESVSSASSLVINMNIVPPPAPPSPSLSEVHSTITNYSQDSVKATALLARLDNVISGALSSIDGKFNELRNGTSSSTVTSPNAPAPVEKEEMVDKDTGKSTDNDEDDRASDNNENEASSATTASVIPEPTIERLTKAALTPTRIPTYGGNSTHSSPRRYESHILPSSFRMNENDNNNNDADNKDNNDGIDDNDEELPQELSSLPVPKIDTSTASSSSSSALTTTITGSQIRERTARAREDARSRVWAQALGELDTSPFASTDNDNVDVISQEENKLLTSVSSTGASSTMGPLQRARMLKYNTSKPKLTSPSTVRLQQLNAIAEKLKTGSNDRLNVTDKDYLPANVIANDDNLELRSRAAQRRFAAWKNRQSGSESSSIEPNRTSSPEPQSGSDTEVITIVDAVRRIDLRASLMPSTEGITKIPSAKTELIVPLSSADNEALGNLISNLRVAIEEDAPVHITEPSLRSVTQPSVHMHSPGKAGRIPRAGPSNNPLLMEDIGLAIPPNTATFTSSFHSTETVQSPGPIIPNYTVSATRMHPVLSLADAALAVADQMVLRQAEEYAHDVIPMLDIPLPPSFDKLGDTVNVPMDGKGTVPPTTNKSYLSRSGVHTAVTNIPPPVLASVPLPPIDGTEITEEKGTDSGNSFASPTTETPNETGPSSETNGTVTNVTSPTALRTTDLEIPVRFTIPHPAPPLQDPGTQTVPKERPQRSLRALSRVNVSSLNDSAANLKLSSLGAMSIPTETTLPSSSSVPVLPLSPYTSSYASVNKSSFANAFSPSLPPTPVLPFTPSVHAYGALGVSGLSYGERTGTSTGFPSSSTLPALSSSMAGRISSIIAPLGSSASLYAAISPAKAIIPSVSLYSKNSSLSSSTFTRF